ncbi:MAG: patatin-like phospholipase family protein [Rhodospirillaceae bacterium]|nr:patatin-like phospholipase family protein [Rhodospirillaceae bacterium]
MGSQQSLSSDHAKDGVYRILSLDGGGAKGFYTLGVLKEIEGMLGYPLHKRFDLIFGTSTGSIIAALLALGNDVDTIYELYKEHVPTVTSAISSKAKSDALSKLANKVFADKTFKDVKTGIGIVATRWMEETPLIFKNDPNRAHGRTGTFDPGFGCKIADAVEASCSAYPFFEKKVITTSGGDKIELIDGGYCANNPSLYAIADAVGPMNIKRENIRVINVGVGIYPEPKPRGFKMWFAKKLLSVQLLQKTLEINTQSMDQLRRVLFKDVPTIRISDAYVEPEMATDLFEHDMTKLRYYVANAPKARRMSSDMV